VAFICIECVRLGRPGYYQCRECRSHNLTTVGHCGVCGKVNPCMACLEQAIQHRLTGLRMAKADLRSTLAAYEMLPAGSAVIPRTMTPRGSLADHAGLRRDERAEELATSPRANLARASREGDRGAIFFRVVLEAWHVIGPLFQGNANWRRAGN
jgi:hypothetical protein